MATEYARYEAEQKEEKVRQHKREKRKAKKKNADEAVEQEKQGMLETNGKDTRRGGITYKKLEDLDSTTDTEAGAADEKQKVDKKMEISLHNLTISETKHRPSESKKIGNDKLDTKEEAKKKNGIWDTQWKRDSRIAEIKKPGWFFSGEDVLKDG